MLSILILIIGIDPINQAIVDFDHDSYHVREAAVEYLLEQDESIIIRMEDELKKDHSLEVKIRCQRVKEEYYGFINDNMPSIWLLPIEHRFITPTGTEETVDIAKEYNEKAWDNLKVNEYEETYEIDTDNIPQRATKAYFLNYVSEFPNSRGKLLKLLSKMQQYENKLKKMDYVNIATSPFEYFLK